MTTCGTVPRGEPNINALTDRFCMTSTANTGRRRRNQHAND